ncbi:sodium/hydrogen exchanger 9B2 isoform X2 [Phlebotomus argentipes]|uniref:sodium/hydrogen exchanger 9B2 isoform X2 n=1 Tax=Phlebotomus argentipes TaxID=94469 RepID=UPI002892C597|nr:sodium/hydrogen exchanger 9B2 isoform X2 [Phlebotomus argentipes]
MAHNESTTDQVITVQPPSPAHTDAKRKVSIVTDPVERHGFDNLAFEQNPKRKISQTSDHSEIGPVHRKSILHNTNVDNDSLQSHHSHDAKTNNGDARMKKHSTTESYHSRANAKDDNQLEQSWIFALCMRCRVPYNTPSWEPKHWQKVCPYPLCPSYRQFANLLALVLIGVLIWVTAYAIIGDSAAPGGQLFGLVVLTVAANFGGWIISLTTLPRLIGMLLVGILFQNVGWVNLDGDFSHVTAELRKVALVIILTRAGLEMDPDAFKRVYITILKLGLVPWTVEAVIIGVMTHFLLGMPWIWGFMLGSIIAAVSPAVVVPCLFRLRTKGYGVAKGIPTLIVAVAGIDDAASVAVFGIISSIMFSSESLGFQIAQAPVCIIGGLGFGVLWGLLSKYVPEKGDAYAVPIRTLMLFGGGLLAVFGSELIKFEGAGPLAVVFAAFVSNYFWCQQGYDIEDNPVATAFEIFWMIFEPILFGITGAAVKINELEPDLVYLGLGCLVTSGVVRIISTIFIAFGDGLNWKEKVFVALSWSAKATVQAALGPVAMKHLTAQSSDEERTWADQVLTICVLSIVLTAPLGAIMISITGPKLLTKTKQPHNTDGWRRSHRPSLRDISIIDEEEEREDPEDVPDKSTINNTKTNTHVTPNEPVYTVTNPKGVQVLQKQPQS